MTLKGNVHKYSKDNIDTDVILPGPYLKIHDHAELSKHARRELIRAFQKVSTGIFTSGNPLGVITREHAPISLSLVESMRYCSFVAQSLSKLCDGGYCSPGS